MRPTRLAFYQDRWWRILGVSFVMYVLSFIDRTNIAMAIPAMRGELHLSAVAIGEATSVLFWGHGVRPNRNRTVDQPFRPGTGRARGADTHHRANPCRFTKPERARANTVFLLSLPIASMDHQFLGVRLAHDVPAGGAARSAVRRARVVSQLGYERRAAGSPAGR